MRFTRLIFAFTLIFTAYAFVYSQPETVKQAEAELRASHFDKCIELASSAIAARPSDQKALRIRAACYASKMQADKKAAPFGATPPKQNGQLAVKDYDDLIAANPNEAELQYYRAAVYFFMTEYELADAGLGRALSLAPKHQPSIDLQRSVKQQLASRAFLAGGEKEQAAEKADGDDKQRLLNEAAQLFTKAIETSPPDCLQYNERARVYTLLKEHRKAIDDHLSCIAADGADDILTYWLLGKAYAEAGDHDLALQTNEKALSILSKRPDAAHQRSDLNIENGSVMMRKGDTAKAIEYFTLAIKDSPRYSSAYVARGRAFAKAGDIASAEADYKKALEIIPGMSDALKALEELKKTN